MSTTTQYIRVAVSQHEPTWLDLGGAVEKTCAIIKDASEKGAKLVTFPECWIPADMIVSCRLPGMDMARPFDSGPESLTLSANSSRSRPIDFELGVKYVQNSLSVTSSEFAVIKAAAAEHKIAVSLGFSERDGESVYIAQAMISATGTLTTKRRKMKPTHMERTIFGDATGGECLVPLVSIPDVGVGEQVHVAAWPPLDPFTEDSPGFYSMSDEGCLTASRMYAIESQAFVLHCATLLTKPGLELMGTAGSPLMGATAVGRSAVIGPDGRVLATTTSSNEEILVADLDLSLITKTKTFADAVGHYSRPDMLWLGADASEKPVVRMTAEKP
ncbi:hypothetical protein MBLNU13_g04492t1 [Cladosporium sp. NU13]